MVDNLLRGDVYRIRCLVEGIALAARAGFKVDVEDLETKKEFLAKVGSVKLHYSQKSLCPQEVNNSHYHDYPK